MGVPFGSSFQTFKCTTHSLKCTTHLRSTTRGVQLPPSRTHAGNERPQCSVQTHCRCRSGGPATATKLRPHDHQRHRAILGAVGAGGTKHKPVQWPFAVTAHTTARHANMYMMCDVQSCHVRQSDAGMAGTCTWRPQPPSHRCPLPARTMLGRLRPHWCPRCERSQSDTERQKQQVLFKRTTEIFFKTVKWLEVGTHAVAAALSCACWKHGQREV